MTIYNILRYSALCKMLPRYSVRNYRLWIRHPFVWGSIRVVVASLESQTQIVIDTSPYKSGWVPPRVVLLHHDLSLCGTKLYAQLLLYMFVFIIFWRSLGRCSLVTPRYEEKSKKDAQMGIINAA